MAKQKLYEFIVQLASSVYRHTFLSKDELIQYGLFLLNEYHCD